MKAFGLNELREMFLSFFESKGHLRLPSFSLIPQNDPSLLLINSGMAPMKPYFTGEQTPPRRRVCTCQKCVRTGDIENIGKTARHGTYFEMLGNFSFGDYFKHEAIAWSWEFLTSPEWVGIDPDRLYPSVYEDDDEAFNIWRDEIGIAPERIFRFGKADNFWEHGTGACGPCSEIYFDRGEKYGCGKPDCTVGCDCDRYIEVWNNVFSQFNSDGQGNYTELAQKNIDTGMGLERLACVCQGVDSLFDVDTVMNITHKVSELTGAHYGESHRNDVSLRVITDHIRSATFMIGDGVLPSNEGRGYVLRRLLRRAARHGKFLGVNEPFLYKVCETVINENRSAYPDLVEKQSFITKVIRTEEESFARTIDGGMRILGELVDELKAKGETVLSGADAFKLYDTYGFPLDLTEDVLGESGMTADTEGFNALMQEQRDRARAARGEISGWSGLDLGLDAVPTVFTGYEKLTDEAKVEALVVEGELSGELREGVEGSVVLDKTPFYAEMGGQVADHGVLTGADGCLFQVTDVQKNKGGKYMHYGKLTQGALKLGDTVSAQIDVSRRKAIMRAHSATHLLDAALKKVLGDHVHQAGSYQDAHVTHFDFTHFSAVTPEELAKVERIVNDKIFEALDVQVRSMPLDEAKKMGAMALFGEKYGEIVRVVDVCGWSTEFCGGTHVQNTAQIGCFKIISESSVAAGIRRIEAVTGKNLLMRANANELVLRTTAAALKANNLADLAARAEAVMAENKALAKELDAVKAEVAAAKVQSLFESAEDVNGVKIITAYFSGTASGTLRGMCDTLRDKAVKPVLAVLVGSDGGKITMAVSVNKLAQEKGLKAGSIVKELSAIAGGKGGGKPDFAMAGLKDPNKIDEALHAAAEVAARQMN